MLVAALLLSFVAEAKVCQDLRLEVTEKIPAPDGVSYFMRPGSKRTVGFATSNGNRLLRLDSGEFVALPGTIDPVPTPDGELISVPVEEPITIEGVTGSMTYMNFFRESVPGKTDLIFKDYSITHNYQSMGTLSRNPQRATYRILYAGSELSARDYVYDRKGKTLKPTGEAAVVCPQPLKGLSIPMLSKDGREFSYFDSHRKTTVIMEIQRPGKACRPKEEIPGSVGKIDFSPDGRRLLFHADGLNDDSGVFEHPDPSYGLGIYLYDRPGKRVVPLHVSRTEDAYYPIFLNNNEIAFVSATRGGDPEARKFFINVASLAGVGKGCARCFTDDKLKAPGSVIGHFYARACRGQEKFQPNAAFMTFASLDAERCRELVRGTADHELLEFSRKNFSEAEMNGLAKREAFLNACDALKRNPVPAKSRESGSGAQSAQ